nr:hypothetical protein [Pandoravirus massiliensis]
MGKKKSRIVPTRAASSHKQHETFVGALLRAYTTQPLAALRPTSEKKSNDFRDAATTAHAGVHQRRSRRRQGEKPTLPHGDQQCALWGRLDDPRLSGEPAQRDQRLYRPGPFARRLYRLCGCDKAFGLFGAGRARHLLKLAVKTGNAGTLQWLLDYYDAPRFAADL